MRNARLGCVTAVHKMDYARISSNKHKDKNVLMVGMRKKNEG